MDCKGKLQMHDGETDANTRFFHPTVVKGCELDDDVLLSRVPWL